MRVAIHQPNFLPWPGYFAKMLAADLLIFLDDVQFSKGSYTNRVGACGTRWLTVPVGSGSHNRPICDVEIVKPEESLPRVQNFIREYFVGPHQEELLDIVRRPLESRNGSLLKLNRGLIWEVGAALRTPRPPEVQASDLRRYPWAKTDGLLQLLKEVSATTYVSGRGGNAYHDEDAFAEAGIAIEYREWKHPHGKMIGDSIAHMIAAYGGEVARDLVLEGSGIWGPSSSAEPEEAAPVS